jgi:hypothetical protein
MKKKFQQLSKPFNNNIIIGRLLSLGVRQGRRLRTTPAKSSSRIETWHQCRCGNRKQVHVGESLDRNGLSD